MFSSSEPFTSWAGSTALSREAQALLSLVEAVLFSLVSGRVEEEHKHAEHGIRVSCKSRCFFLVPGKSHSPAKQVLVLVAFLAMLRVLLIA